MIYLYVAIGGALGSVGRYALSNVVARSVAEVFPWGTLVVNVTGCFMIGLFAALTAPGGRVSAPLGVRQFVMVGICGGYTTFSSFSLQTLMLAREGDMTRATLNVVASVLFCLLGVWLGSIVGVALNQMKGV